MGSGYGAACHMVFSVALFAEFSWRHTPKTSNGSRYTRSNRVIRSIGVRGKVNLSKTLLYTHTVGDTSDHNVTIL